MSEPSSKKSTRLEQVEFLKPFLESICISLKSFLKKELPLIYPQSSAVIFAKKDRLAMKSHELAEGIYKAAFAPNGEPLMELIANRWVENHLHIYRWMEARLLEITDDYTKLSTLSPEESKQILQEGCLHFNPVELLIFCVFNWVVVHPDVLKELYQALLDNKQTT